jgi:hypothetical protein
VWEPVPRFEPTLIGSARRYWWVVAAGTLAAALVALIASPVLSSVGLTGAGGAASATVLVQDPVTATGRAGGVPPDPQRYAADQAAVLQSRTVIQRAVRLINSAQRGNLGVDDVQKNLVVTGHPEDNVINLALSAPTAAQATAALSAVLTSYQQYVDSATQSQIAATVRSIDADLAAARARLAALQAGGSAGDAQAISALQQRITSLDAERVATIGTSGVSLVRVLSAPSSPGGSTANGTPPLLRLLTGVLLGLVGGLALAYALARRRPRINHPLDPQAVLQAPLLGEVREQNGRSVDGKPAVLDDSFAVVAATLARAGPASDSGRIHAFLSASTLPSGAATARTGVALARQGARVAVVDADRDRAVATLTLGGDAAAQSGLADVGRLTSAGDAIRAVNLDNDVRVSLVGPGSEEIAPKGLPPVSAFLNDLRETHDHVVVDLPTPFGTPAQLMLAQRMDDIVVVVHHAASARSLQQLAATLQGLDLPIAGYVYEHDNHRG